MTWNVPFDATPIGSYFLGSGAGAAGTTAGTAAAGAGAAGGLSGPLAALGGPAGLGIMAGTALLGGIASTNAAEASMQAAKEQAKLGFVSNLAGQRFLDRARIGDQMQALQNRSYARRAGLYGPEDFAGLLSSGMTPASAMKYSYSPLFRGT